MLARPWPYVSWKCTASAVAGTPAPSTASTTAPTARGVPTPIVSPSDTWFKV